jgi:hypothetical protein
LTKKDQKSFRIDLRITVKAGEKVRLFIVCGLLGAADANHGSLP